MKALSITIIGLIVVALLFVAYYGGFKTITFKTSLEGGEILVYEDLTGDYSKSGEAMDRVFNSLLSKEKIKSTKGFGIYYDDPKKVEKSKLKSEVGCIVDGIDSLKIADLKKRYKVKICPRTNYLTTNFPHKNMLSIMFGIMKVYPAMSKYIEQNGLSEKGPIMEIYDTPNKTIEYRKEIVQKLQ
ncbi:MAG: GyrI-like domain-containing protein [Paludibacter sp.]